MSYRRFRSTEEAYNQTQTDETLVKGTVLVIPSEQVVGLADTWPIAITQKNGELHTVSAETDHLDYLARRGFTLAHVQMAVATAIAQGWPVSDRWMEVACAGGR